MDYNLFTPGLVLPANTVWVAEQLPGVIVPQDVTDIAGFGYWPSYNRAYSPEIFALAGVQAMVCVCLRACR